MKSQTFKLEIKNGTLVIPTVAMEYLNQCQGEIEVSLTIQTTVTRRSANSSSLSEGGGQDFQQLWSRWLAEVDQLEPSSTASEPDEYSKILIEKYRKQGLEL